MISYIRGERAAVEEDRVVVEAGGIGYGIFMSGSAIGRLPSVGSQVKIHTYFSVKEDSMQLFGFLTRDDLEVFRLVIGVSGIGPKGGLNILSQLTPDELRFAVFSGTVLSGSIQNDAVQALVALGYGNTDALKAVRQVEITEDMQVEDVLKRALKLMMF